MLVRLLLVAVVAALAVPAAATADRARLAKGSASFSDPAGDANTAPDITSVQVANDDKGTVTMQISTPGTASFGADTGLVLVLDSDRDEKTGDEDGFDIILTISAGGHAVAAWNGTGYADVTPVTLKVGTALALTKLEFSSAEFGIAAGFDFYLAGVKDQGPDATPIFDFAPNEKIWSYELKFTPEAGAVAVAPARPVAGGSFIATMIVTMNGASLEKGTTTCAARIGAKPLKVTSRAFSRGAARCTFAVPKNAKGKTIRGSLTVTIPFGGTLTKTFSARAA